MINRIARLWSAVVGTQLTEMETHHAEALLDLEREDLHRKVASYNHGLAGYAALSERLRSGIARLERERDALEPKLKARMDAGDRVGAGRHALRLEAIAQEVASHHRQLEETESTYRELVRAREVALHGAREKIDALKRSIGDFKMQQALAELNELAAGMEGSLVFSDGRLDRLKERLDDKRDLAAGRARVARDALHTADARDHEADQAALGEAALRRLETAGLA